MDLMKDLVLSKIRTTIGTVSGSLTNHITAERELIRGGDAKQIRKRMGPKEEFFFSSFKQIVFPHNV